MGLGGQGNAGVAGTIRQTEGSIGYIELIYALQNKIPFGSVKNAAGQFAFGDGLLHFGVDFDQLRTIEWLCRKTRRDRQQ